MIHYITSPFLYKEKKTNQSLILFITIKKTYNESVLIDQVFTSLHAVVSQVKTVGLHHASATPGGGRCLPVGLGSRGRLLLSHYCWWGLGRRLAW